MIALQLREKEQTLEMLESLEMLTTEIRKQLQDEIVLLENQLKEHMENTKGLGRYVITDMERSFWADDLVYYAKNSAEAIRAYMQDKGIIGSIKRSASRYVRFKAIKTYINDGKASRTGNDIWYLFERND